MNYYTKLNSTITQIEAEETMKLKLEKFNAKITFISWQVNYDDIHIFCLIWDYSHKQCCPIGERNIIKIKVFVTQMEGFTKNVNWNKSQVVTQT